MNMLSLGISQLPPFIYTPNKNPISFKYWSILILRRWRVRNANIHSAFLMIAFSFQFLKQHSHFLKEGDTSMEKNLILSIRVSQFFLFIGPNRQLTFKGISFISRVTVSTVFYFFPVPCEREAVWLSRLNPGVRTLFSFKVEEFSSLVPYYLKFSIPNLECQEAMVNYSHKNDNHTNYDS